MADIACYARVSTDNQDLSDQRERLREWAENRGHSFDLYSETVSGKDDDRKQFQQMMDAVQDGEYELVVVTKIDRFGRSTRSILQNIDMVDEYGASFYTIDQPIDTRDDSMMGEMMKQILSVFADFERRMIRRRMERGFEQAQADGRVGRPRKLDDDMVEEAQNKYDRGWSIKQVHAWLQGEYDVDCSYRTVRRYLDT